MIFNRAMLPGYSALFLHADGRLAKAHMVEIAPEQIATEIARLH